MCKIISISYHWLFWPNYVYIWSIWWAADLTVLGTCFYTFTKSSSVSLMLWSVPAFFLSNSLAIKLCHPLSCSKTTPFTCSANILFFFHSYPFSHTFGNSISSPLLPSHLSRVNTLLPCFPILQFYPFYPCVQPDLFFHVLSPRRPCRVSRYYCSVVVFQNFDFF